MNPRLAKLLAAARRQPDDAPLPALPPESGRRLYLLAQQQQQPDTSSAWLRGMAWGTAACAAAAIVTACLPAPQREAPVPELLALAGAIPFNDEPDPQP